MCIPHTPPPATRQTVSFLAVYNHTRLFKMENITKDNISDFFSFLTTYLPVFTRVKTITPELHFLFFFLICIYVCFLIFFMAIPKFPEFNFELMDNVYDPRDRYLHALYIDSCIKVISQNSNNNNHNILTN